jgi:glucose-6-phosphate isomerase
MSLRYSNSGSAQQRGASSTGSTSWALKCTDLPQFDALQAAADEFDEDPKLHLRNLCGDAARCAGLAAVHHTAATTTAGIVGGTAGDRRVVVLDYSRQRVTGEVAELLYDLADAMSLQERIRAMRSGANVNATENRPVLHHLLRSPILGGGTAAAAAEGENEAGPFSLSSEAEASGQDPLKAEATTTTLPPPSPSHPAVKPETVGRRQQSSSATGQRSRNAPPAEVSTDRIVKDVQQGRDKIKAFSEQFRRGNAVVGATGRPLRSVVVVGSASVPAALACAATSLSVGDAQAQRSAEGRSLVFVRNVDPADAADVARRCRPEETMILVISKTFAESDVILNAKALRRWLSGSLHASEDQIARHHFCAVSCNPTRSTQFGIPRDRVFRLGEWVVPRFATCSAAGLLPLSLVFGWDTCLRLMQGCHDMDEHFFHAPLRDNIPVILGLLGLWNSTFLGYPCRAIIPYSEALRDFPDFVRRVDAESNGKRVALDGTSLLHQSAEVTFGGPGTSCQDGFFQLLHQGRSVPADFIGFMEGPSSSTPIGEGGADSNGGNDEGTEAMSGHDELMSQFFAQPDALAYGKTLVDRTCAEERDLFSSQSALSSSHPLTCSKRVFFFFDPFLSYVTTFSDPGRCPRAAPGAHGVHGEPSQLFPAADEIRRVRARTAPCLVRAPDRRPGVLVGPQQLRPLWLGVGKGPGAQGRSADQRRPQDGGVGAGLQLLHLDPPRAIPVSQDSQYQ